MDDRILEWVDDHIEQKHTLLDIATVQPMKEMKHRAEGHLEMLYCLRDFIISTNDL